MDLLELFGMLAAAAYLSLLWYCWAWTIRRADEAKANPPTDPGLTVRAWRVACFVTYLAFLAAMSWAWWTWRE
jgi:hypothetical protein